MRAWILVLASASAACGHSGGGGTPPWKMDCARNMVLLSCPEDKVVVHTGPQAASTMTIGAWYRFAFASGHAVDGQLVGGDAAAYFVQLPNGVFSIRHADVRAVTPLAPPAR